ncbi:hypothetical protein K469DRAFT_612687 [Zopfia rhizophila CBS 207.26]|uniref:BTB domain-containing protein n=1 Tax=Zopfia rhizophila CBS 207.26 TaxID=1314779 RepID=A0A6A6DAF8_9PEZI|nr:hypothetical protein K469DRAFT_612687 [Zopfia rhizophila CBS 207.26]
MVQNDLKFHAEMYIVADKYQFTGLKDLIQRKFEYNSFAYYNTPEFVDAILTTYELTLETNKGLKELTAKVIARN